MELLTIGNPKIQKGTDHGYLSAVLHFAPADRSGFQVCPHAKDCIAVCLNLAGRGGILPRGETSNAIQRARVRRTQLFFRDRATFWAQLARDLERVITLAEKHGLRPAVRLNGTSDLPWERIAFPGAPGRPAAANVMSAYPDVTFYDYTKYPLAARRELPANYSLTFSLDTHNAADARRALERGRNVAVVFSTARGAALPSAYVIDGLQVPVIDGDAHDLRFLDPAGVIVGLRAKGPARRDHSGFVVQLAA